MERTITVKGRTLRVTGRMEGRWVTITSVNGLGLDFYGLKGDGVLAQALQNTPGPTLDEIERAYSAARRHP